MSGLVRWSKAVPRAMAVRFWQDRKKSAPRNCVGMQLRCFATSLPFVPSFTPVDAVQGRFQMTPPTIAQLAAVTGARHELRLVLENSSGVPVEEVLLQVQVS
jgi:hypothetical protein